MVVFGQKFYQVVHAYCLPHEEREAVNILQGDAGPFGHAVQRVFGNVERYVDLILQALVESAEQSTSAAEIDTILHDVGIKLGGRVLQG